MNYYENSCSAIENNKSESQEIIEKPFLPLEMYQVSGHKNITEYSLARYLRDGKYWEKEIHKAYLAENLLKNQEQLLTDEKDKSTREDLRLSSIKERKKIIEKICYAPENKRASLIREILNSSSIKEKKEATRMISFAPENEREELLKEAVNILGDRLIESPLYDNLNEKSSFSREEFIKTGSKTTLIGGEELKNKAIIRHINPSSFLVWKNLYEDYQLWRQNGFDYVPIEPIFSYKLGKDDKVIVFSGVLDLDLSKWQGITSRFVNELEVVQNKIIAVLDKKNIQHGHPNEGNFCLRFWRDENNRPDINNKTPRLYLIDFDKASISENKNRIKLKESRYLLTNEEESMKVNY